MYDFEAELMPDIFLMQLNIQGCAKKQN